MRYEGDRLKQVDSQDRDSRVVVFLRDRIRQMKDLTNSTGLSSKQMNERIGGGSGPDVYGYTWTKLSTIK